MLSLKLQRLSNYIAEILIMKRSFITSFRFILSNIFDKIAAQVPLTSSGMLKFKRVYTPQWHFCPGLKLRGNNPHKYLIMR